MRVWSLFSCFYLTLSLSLSLSCVHVNATIPTIDFTGLLTKYATTTDSWCTTCAAFSTQCSMGCAGDTGGGGPCPADACPRVFTFSTINSQPVWNILVATSSNPYRAFSYIPLCTQSSQCTEPFVFSFSLYYTPAEGAATSNVFGKQEDYLKLLFWGDGNNILGVKNGQLLGAPNGGGGDLVGSTTTGTNNAFSTPFVSNTWMHVAVQLTYSNNRATLAFWVNGAAIGSTTGSIGTSNSGLQFGAYVWGGTFFTLQYKDIAITPAGQIPSPSSSSSSSPATSTTTTTATPTTAVPTKTAGSGSSSSSSTGKNNAGAHHIIENGTSIMISLALILILTM